MRSIGTIVSLFFTILNLFASASEVFESCYGRRCLMLAERDIKIGTWATNYSNR